MKIKSSLFILFVLLLVVITPVKGHTSNNTGWLVHIKVSVPDSRTADGTVWNHLIAGTHDGATDGFDGAWDTPTMIETDDPVQAIFTHGTLPEDSDNDGMIDNWSCSNPEAGYDNFNCSLWRDVRVFDSEKVWSFVVLSQKEGDTVSLQWSFESKPEDAGITLVDLTAPDNSIDMKSSSSYSYTNYFEPGRKYGIRYFEIRMKTTSLALSPPTLPDATVGVSYNEKLAVTGRSFIWSLESGELPQGMSIDANTGDVTGTPASSGVYTFTIKGYDPVTGDAILWEYTLDINSLPWITALNLPDGDVGVSYSGEITVTGGSSPFTWDITGNLPEGLILDTKTGVVSGLPLVPGIYDFSASVSDANGATYIRGYIIKIIQPEDTASPEPVTDLKGIYLDTSSLLLRWTAPADNSMIHTAARYDLRYMEGCTDTAGLNEGVWDDAVEVNGEPRPQAEALQTYTMTGLKSDKSYCFAVKGMDSSGNVSLISNVVMFPLSPDSQNGEGISNMTSMFTLRKGYNLISLPLIPVPNLSDSVFGTYVGNPAGIYRWYSAYPGITPQQYYREDIVMPGYGYFLYSPADDISMTINGVKIGDPEYSVRLEGGWNMAGNPYDKSILLSNISVRDIVTGENKNYTDAVKDGWIGNTLYDLKGGNYEFTSFNDDPPAKFKPWTGYWIYVGNPEGVEIIFRRP